MRKITTLPTIPKRDPDGHKGDFGKTLIVAGSTGMSGAAILCGQATLRGGAGLVRVAVPSAILPVVATGHPCYTTLPMPCDESGRLSAAALAKLVDVASENDALAVGPGLGQSDDLKTLLFEMLPQINIPMVLDADALNNLADRPEIWSRCQAPVIVTPHPGEFARLTGHPIDAIQSNRVDGAMRYAAEHGLIVLLKGNQTLVTDGDRLYRNKTGNPGMATGGCGDVLTGLIAALLGQGLAPFDAAQLGAYLHGKAGDLARDTFGEISLIATDVLDCLSVTFKARN